MNALIRSAALLLCILMLFSVVACADTGNGKNNMSSDDMSSDDDTTDVDVY